MGFGSGMTCWRRVRDWQAAGVWHGLNLALRDELVERTHAWLAAFGKLRTRFKRRSDIHVALLSLACCVSYLRSLPSSCWPL